MTPNNATPQTFKDGMMQDPLPSMQPDSTYRSALNMLNHSRDSAGTFIATEEGNRLVAEFEGTVLGSTYIEERNQTLVFVKDSGSSLYLFDHETEEKIFVARDTEFCCDWGFRDCEYMYGEFKPQGPCDELHVYFSANCTYYRVNIDEMLNPARKEALKECVCENENNPKTCGTLSCDYFRLFNCVCGPKIVPIVSDSGGSGLEAGTYQFAARLIDNHGNDTNWFWVTNPVNLGSDSNIPGEVSRGAIELDISGLDCRYDKIEIAVIKTVAGATTVEILDTRNYTSRGMTFEYYGQRGELVDLANIMTKRKTYIKGSDLIQHDGSLWLYRIKQEKNLNWQRRVFEADVEWLEYEVSIEQQQRHQYPSLARSEKYLFGVEYNYCDGTSSHTFLLSPSGGGENGGDNQGLVISPEKVNKIQQGNTSNATQQSFVDEGGGAERQFGGIGYTEEKHERIIGGADMYGKGKDDLAAYEDVLQGNLDEWCTEVDALCQGITCENCSEIASKCECDSPHFDSISENWLDVLTSTGLDEDVADVSRSSSIKDASATLIREAVKKAEWIRRKAPQIKGSNDESSWQPKPKGNQEAASSDVPFGHQLVDINGVNQTEEPLRVTASGKFGVRYSEELYPDMKDCDGEFVYGSRANRNVELFEVPSKAQRPVMISYQKGVVNRHQPDNYELGEGYVRLIGLKVTNIPIPTPEDLPKPLCPNQPYRIVMVPRDRINSTVLASGFAVSTFTGNVRGKRYNFGRHGLNSFESVDRHVDDQGRRNGDAFSDHPAYLFYSLDTRVNQPGLAPDRVLVNGLLEGYGWRHGLYAKGPDPEDVWNGRRVDQRGTRQSVNINQFVPIDQSIPISGITYAPADTTVTPPAGIDYPLMNKFRESSVYFQAEELLPGRQTDGSFVGDTLNHEAPINDAFAWDVTLIRDLPDQYGSVEGLRFVDTGLVAGRGNTGSIQGPVGDVYIGYDTLVRKGYVSNKNGNEYRTGNFSGGSFSFRRLKSICQSPNTKILDITGINNYPSRLPDSGDGADPRNFAGLHTDFSGPDNAVGDNPKPWDVALNEGFQGNDVYYPKVVKTLVIYPGEFRANPFLRQTGRSASQIGTGQVFYGKLKDLYLDSAAPHESPWKESFLNRFYCEVEQPSRNQLLKKAIIRNMVSTILPGAGVASLFSMETPIDAAGGLIAMPMLIAIWYLLQKVLTRNDYLDELLGIKSCKTDLEGGEFDDCIRQFEDNYDKYNFDYSRLNYENLHFSIKTPFYSCDCDDCSKGETTNEVFYSNKQILGSNIDAYKNFRAHSYLEIPAHNGKLMKLFKEQNNFYAHTTDQIYLIQFGAATTSTSIGTALLGGNDMLIRPQPIIDGVVEGFAGTINPNASINTSFGYIFVDSEAGKLYNFSGGRVIEFSNNGMFHFFQNKLKICNIDDCHDEKTVGGTFYSLGWDPRYMRLLITKRDGNDKDSFTISYTPQGGVSNGSIPSGKFLSFHSYNPENYVWDRSNLYSFKDNKLYKHHEEGVYRTFYGKEYPSMVEIVTPTTEGMSEKYTSTVFDTDAYVHVDGGYAKDPDITWDSVAVWNSTQGTGTMKFRTISDDRGRDERVVKRDQEVPGEIRLTKKRRRWSFNQVHDNRKLDCLHEPMTIFPSKCSPIDDINETVFDCKPSGGSGYTNRNLDDQFVMYRFYYDGPNNVRLYFKNLLTLTHNPDKKS